MRILITLLMLIHFSVNGQQAEPLLFSEKTFDFGEISESDGHADHEFQFTNNSGRAVKILTVQPSCGCTTPDWSKEPVPPGKAGFIKASFDPKGRPGYFNKSLTVTTDLDGTPFSLQIKGQVVNKTKSPSAVDFPAQNGALRFKFSSFNIGRIFINQAPAPKNFDVYNAGDKTVSFTGANILPAYLTVETPKSLIPGQSGVIRLTYNAKLRNQFGFVNDNVQLATDDEMQAIKSFSVYATIEEYFPPVSNAELAKAPAMRLDLPVFDFGRIHQGTNVVRELLIRNAGRKELLIRSVQGNCTCVTAIAEAMKIKAGGETKLTITLSTQGRIGLQQKAVTIYSNDPKNPVQRITFTAYVETP